MDVLKRFVYFMRDYAFARTIIPIGLIVVAVGVYACFIYNNRVDYPRCEATVTDFEMVDGSDGEDSDKTYRNYIKYTVDGQEYEGSIVGSRMKIGSRVTVDYNPEDPSDVGEWTGLWLPVLLISLGAAAVAAGCISIVVTHKSNKTSDRVTKT